MSGRGKRDHWSTKDDPFSISEPPRRSPSPELGEPSTGLLISFDDDENGASGSGYTPASETAPSAPPKMDIDVDEPKSWGTRQQFQGQEPQFQHSGSGGGIYPTLKDPEIGRLRNYHETAVMSQRHATSTHASGNTGKLGSSAAWSSGNGDPSVNYNRHRQAPTVHTHLAAAPVTAHTTYSGGGTFPLQTGAGHSRRIGSHSSNTHASDEEEESGPRSTGMKQAMSSRSNSQQKISIVKSMDEISDFGKWELLTKEDKMHKMITIYVNNSVGLETSDGDVHIHQICQLASGWDLSWPRAHSNKMLLWYKTTPGGIKYLKRKSDGCIAFYDRIARAFPVKPADLEQPLRQIILLCTVALGNCQESSQGYRGWSDKGLPRGSNSVKGIGHVEPDSNENRKKVSKLQGDTIIPCGKTVTNKKYQNCELEYSEYLVFEAERIKVEYAVDIEIIPK